MRWPRKQATHTVQCVSEMWTTFSNCVCLSICPYMTADHLTLYPGPACPNVHKLQAPLSGTPSLFTIASPSSRRLAPWLRRDWCLSSNGLASCKLGLGVPCCYLERVLLSIGASRLPFVRSPPLIFVCFCSHPIVC